jgi:hypothetical protein
MKPSELTEASFSSYPQGSQPIVHRYLSLLQKMPLSMLPAYLIQMQSYASLFPVEQARLQAQLAGLAARPELMQTFAAIVLPSEMEHRDWIQRPGVFEDALSGALWQTRQIDAYHQAGEALFAALPPPARDQKLPPPLLLAVIGQGTGAQAPKSPAEKANTYPLFARLRGQGLYAHNVDGDGAAEILCGTVRQRAQADGNAAYAHWYVDGGVPWPLLAESVESTAPVNQFTFPSLAPVTDVVLREMDRAVRKGVGPEVLADRLREMQPAQLGLSQVTSDPRMARFFITLLTQGSGTQLYSTSFVQAAGVELVRRAEPQTLLLRFAPRRRPASMNDMLEQRAQSVEVDPQGSLVDADMAVYYAWLAMQRLPGGEQARLLVHVEGHGEALVIGPGVTRGVDSNTPVTLKQLLAQLA